MEVGCPSLSLSLSLDCCWSWALVDWTSSWAGLPSIRAGLQHILEMVELQTLGESLTRLLIKMWFLGMQGTYVQNCQIDEAVRPFTQMPEKNAVSWTTMINGYVHFGNLNEAKKLLDTMTYNNVGAQTAMISGYVQSERMDEARRIFYKIGTRDVVCWNTMIAGYMDEDLHLFRQMLQKNIVSWNTMIYGYAQAGQMDKVRKIFEEMGEKNIVSWNTLISGFAQNGLFVGALKRFSLMTKDGKEPDQSTFVFGLSSCAILQLCKLESNFTKLWKVVMRMTFSVGRLEEAFKLVREMKIEANAGSWGALLSDCRIHRNLELGCVAAEKLSKLEPHKTLNYVLLSNLHAKAGRWDEVESMRTLTTERGAEKQPGCSWIEYKNQLHVFLSDDGVQPQLPDIGDALNNLTAQMKTCNFMPETKYSLHDYV
ncbi:pentatricopeptide repeat (PPR) superfamily protein [Actinidia rufa]|uniref:Pentatricopeptide repeat (PPR) superfamily protein n=1 Tax=Actinidia rufa TaxID=165716 RepID=A0A7J0F3T1_9ERIC|nr:pentatricopeptide repeat (PPR) superfamily protein [Actinidia rufa]